MPKQSTFQIQFCYEFWFEKGVMLSHLITETHEGCIRVPEQSWGIAPFFSWATNLLQITIPTLNLIVFFTSSIVHEY